MDINRQTCFRLPEGLWLCKLNLLCRLSLSMCLITVFLCYIHIWWSLGPIIFKSLIEVSWRRSQLLTIKCNFQQQWSVFRETWSKHMVLKYPLKHNFSFLSLHSMLKWNSWKTHPCQGRSINASPFHDRQECDWERERELDSLSIALKCCIRSRGPTSFSQLEYSGKCLVCCERV